MFLQELLDERQPVGALPKQSRFLAYLRPVDRLIDFQFLVAKHLIEKQLLKRRQRTWQNDPCHFRPHPLHARDRQPMVPVQNLVTVGMLDWAHPDHSSW